jgi:hypothetical protein
MIGGGCGATAGRGGCGIASRGSSGGTSIDTRGQRVEFGLDDVQLFPKQRVLSPNAFQFCAVVCVHNRGEK